MGLAGSVLEPNDFLSNISESESLFSFFLTPQVIYPNSRTQKHKFVLSLQVSNSIFYHKQTQASLFEIKVCSAFTSCPWTHHMLATEIGNPVAPWAMWTKCHYLNWKESIHQHVGNLVLGVPTHWHITRTYPCLKQNIRTTTKTTCKKWISGRVQSTSILPRIAAKSHRELKLWMQQNHEYGKSPSASSTFKLKHLWDGFLEGPIFALRSVWPVVPKWGTSSPTSSRNTPRPDANWACSSQFSSTTGGASSLLWCKQFKTIPVTDHCVFRKCPINKNRIPVSVRTHTSFAVSQFDLVPNTSCRTAWPSLVSACAAT